MKKLFILLIIPLLSFTIHLPTKVQDVVDHAKWQSTQYVTYDGSYVRLDYPGGDVPANKGVCTDVVIRAYRNIDIDLQVLIHRDMKKAIDVYNKKYRTKAIDASIDHRRTQNIETFLTRQGAAVPITLKDSDYKPGDIVFWDIANGHVGIVIDKKVPGTNRYCVVHNIGGGPQIEDFIFSASIIGHYRWYP
jgi:uncharacterized protein